MAQPDPYTPVHDYTDWQTNNPDEPIPGPFLDNDYNAISVSIDQIIVNLGLIQRDDGALANESVDFDQLTPEVINAITGGEGGLTLDTLTDVTVTNPADLQYLQYDAGSGQWINVSLSPVAPAADQVSFDPTQTPLVSVNVQDAIDEHVLSTGNPHGVTQGDIGLPLVANSLQLGAVLNLSDLTDAAEGRTNLDVYSKSESDGLHVNPNSDVTFAQTAGVQQEWKDQGTTGADIALTFVGESNRKVVEISGAVEIQAPTDGVGSMEMVVVQNLTGGYIPTFSGFVLNAPEVQWDTAPGGETWFLVERYRLPNAGTYLSRIQQRRWD